MQLKSILKNNTFFSLFIIYLIIGFYPATLSKLDFHLWFNQFHNKTLDIIFPIITYLGDGLGWVIFCIIFLFISYKGSLLILLSGALSGLITQTLKRFVFNEFNRPTFYFKEDELSLVNGVENHLNFSFPSGHSTSAFALFCALSLIINKPKISVAFFLLAFSASISRVYLHQHFFIDTYAGAIIGVGSALLLYKIIWPKVNSNPKWGKSLLSLKK